MRFSLSFVGFLFNWGARSPKQAEVLEPLRTHVALPSRLFLPTHLRECEDVIVTADPTLILPEDLSQMVLPAGTKFPYGAPGHANGPAFISGYEDMAANKDAIRLAGLRAEAENKGTIFLVSAKGQNALHIPDIYSPLKNIARYAATVADRMGCLTDTYCEMTARLGGRSAEEEAVVHYDIKDFKGEDGTYKYSRTELTVVCANKTGVLYSNQEKTDLKGENDCWSSVPGLITCHDGLRNHLTAKRKPFDAQQEAAREIDNAVNFVFTPKARRPKTYSRAVCNAMRAAGKKIDLLGSTTSLR